MLVAFGEFLQQEGLLDQLRRVPIAQKTRGLAPQAKLIEWLAGITPAPAVGGHALSSPKFADRRAAVTVSGKQSEPVLVLVGFDPHPVALVQA